MRIRDRYDPNRSANIALICYADGTKSYILAPQGLTDGMEVMSGEHAEAKVGNCLPLSLIPVGAQVHNIELLPGKGGQLVRSAGNAAQLMACLLYTSRIGRRSRGFRIERLPYHF